MRVLVTGGAGFLGSHLVERLLARGDEVLVLDDLSTGSSANLAGVARDERLAFLVASVLDEEALAEAARGVDVLVHLAAAVGVRRVLHRPGDALERNVLGVVRALDAARPVGARLLFASSSEVYGRVPRVPAHEDDPVLVGLDDAPRWGYARAKLFGELLARDAREAGDVDSLSVRLFNTVGPRQVGVHGMVVPRFVDAALSGRPLVVHGDGRQRRAFAHVADVADALAALVHLPAFAPLGFHALNLGGTEEVAIGELARRVLARTGGLSHVVHEPLLDPAGRPVAETPRRVPDLGRARSLLGPLPTCSLERILDEVLAERAARRGPVALPA